MNSQVLKYGGIALVNALCAVTAYVGSVATDDPVFPVLFPINMVLAAVLSVFAVLSWGEK
jgi:hypothetical protein